jgi:AcrR family transcriptional regulator
MANGPDRRTLRTQSALRQALIELLERKAFDAITVQEIIDQANIGRSTFYAHCTGKEDLLRRSLRLLGTELAEAQRAARAAGDAEKGRRLTFSLPMLEHIAEHRRLYPAVSRGRAAEIFQAEMRSLAVELIGEDFAALGLASHPAAAVMRQFVVGGFMSLLTWWQERRLDMPPAELDAIFQQLALPGLAAQA